MKLLAAWASDVGRVRSGNEDSLLIDERLGVFAVADGMGGHRGGEVASSTAVEAVRAALATGVAIDGAIRAANVAIRERAFGDPEVAGMGTTFTAVVPLEGSAVLVGHVGDSRAYLIHDEMIRRLTRDHSLVEDLVREGQLTEEQAESHPQRSIITRALGIEPDVEVDLYTVAVAAGDRIIICSDGLSDMLSDHEIVTAARGEGRAAADRLIDAANDAGGTDNITVVVLDVTDVEQGSALADLAPSDTRAGAAAEPTIALDLPPDPQPEVADPGRGERLIRWARVALVITPIVLIAAVAYFAVWLYASNRYFVSADEQGGEVVIWKGVEGGIMGFEPTVVERSGLRTGTLTQSEGLRVRNGFCEGSLERARECIDQLRDARSPSSSTTLPSTTATTVPTATTSRSTTSTSPTKTARSTTSPTPASQLATLGPTHTSPA